MEIRNEKRHRDKQKSIYCIDKRESKRHDEVKQKWFETKGYESPGAEKRKIRDVEKSHLRNTIHWRRT